MTVVKEYSLGERLFEVGARLATAEPHEIGPILTANMDDVMTAWAEKGSGLLTEVLGLTYSQLHSWKKRRGLPTPPPRTDEPLSPVSDYMPAIPVQPMRQRRQPCPRCRGLVMQGADHEGTIVQCLNCGYAG